MKQKILFLLASFVTLFLALPVTHSYALEKAMPIIAVPPVNTTEQTLFGENQYYTVTFRGNGEAIVTMKAIITNNNTDPISAVKLHIPSNVDMSNVIGYQVLAQPQCIQYSNEAIAKPTCLQYQPPDYQYVGNDTKYQKLSVEKFNTILAFSLPTPIKQNDTGSYLLSYRTFNYTQKNFFGAYDFTFRSLSVDESINALQIGITTDSDLYIKNAKGTVNYDTSAAKMMAVPQAAGGAIQNQRFNDFYNQIGQGTVIKNASDLAPLESYTTKGTYADSGMKLYSTEIVTTSIVILTVLAIVFGIILFMVRRSRIPKEKRPSSKVTLFFITAGISFGSIVLAAGYTVIVIIVFTLLNANTYYGYANNMFVNLLVTGLSGAVYLFFLFVPAIIMTIKKGFVWGGLMLGLTMMWAIIATVVIFGVMYLFFNNNNPTPIIRPLMMSGQTAPAAMMEKAQ